MSWRRSHRSASTPASWPKKKPGPRRARSTKATAPSGVPGPTSAALIETARKNTHSPVDVTSWASQSRRHSGVPHTRLRNAGQPPNASCLEATRSANAGLSLARSSGGGTASIPATLTAAWSFSSAAVVHTPPWEHIAALCDRYVIVAIVGIQTRSESTDNARTWPRTQSAETYDSTLRPCPCDRQHGIRRASRGTNSPCPRGRT